MVASTPSALLLLLLLASSSEAKLTCNVVVGYLEPCLTYLKGGNEKPPVACCDGAHSLVSAATSVDDRRTACSGIKAIAQVIKPNPQNSLALPNNCGIRFPYPISSAMDILITSSVEINQAINETVGVFISSLICFA